MSRQISAEEIIVQADQLRRTHHDSFREEIVRSVYNDAERISRSAIRQKGRRYGNFDQVVDRFLTSPLTGLPVMAFILAVIFWVTIVGANYPSQILATFLFWIEKQASLFFTSLGVPWWLTGFIWHGVYRALAWVIAVMLPPMAIFFPLFTILEDLGYLPRVAFNMDRLFKKCGAHGKQSLTMSMGFGCNAAGIVATRIIDSPRERLIAILTNNFVPCNGRFPTLIMLGTVFVGAKFHPGFASIAAAGSVMAIVGLGIIITLIVSAILSKTILKGEPSSFTLELPPYRRPSFLRVFYTSLIDRTLFVLYRAVIMAIPAGAVIWLLGNISVSGQSLTTWISSFLNPFGLAIGLDGVILLAYIIAIPANEIVVPAILMAYANADKMFELESMNELQSLLVGQEGWTLLTAVCLMLFSLLHNPCSTTIWTTWKETRSVKWTTLGALMPLAIAFLVTFVVAQAAYFFGWA